MKRKIITLLLTMSLASVIGASAVAAEEKVNGFYDIGTSQNVTINPFSGDTSVSATEKNIDSDEALEKIYENSNRLGVTYTDAANEKHYGVILVEGLGLPTKDSEIYYINQETASSTNVDFNVYPKLPTETKDMTLYISSNKEDFSLVSIPVNYAVNATVVEEPETPSYTLGDLDDNGEVNVADVIMTRRHIVGGYEQTIREEAADVDKNGKVEPADVITIRRYIAGGYGVELK
ncbi:MAG: dockerin type I repeat-containing protein [Clostridia bacterium]|nr:dockerin type I repeat-containing protein [Clostridia bacterium]